MFHIHSIEIDGFWRNKKATAHFDDDVNIIIGKNGTGKTTFINHLFAALTADPVLLLDLYFDTITIQLASGTKSRQIVVTRDSSGPQYTYANYRIGTRKFTLPLIRRRIEQSRQARVRSMHNDMFFELRHHLAEIVNVSSLSVHRHATDPLQEEEPVRREEIKSAVDSRLDHLLQRLTRFQLSLSKQADEVSAKFEKDVLISLLYDPSHDTFDLNTLGSAEIEAEVVRKTVKT